MTPQKIANEINRLKPNLKDFWIETSKMNWDSTLTLDSNTSINLFKFELISILNAVHPRFYIYSVFLKNKSDYYTKVKFTPHNLKYGAYSLLNKGISSEPNLISAHIDNLKQYLNPYLRKKLGFVKTKADTVSKLEENEFSLELFKNVLTKRKLSSTEGIEYFNQIKDFNTELRNKFMDVIFEHCIPSKKFLKLMEDSYLFEIGSSTSNKYIILSRSEIRNLANNLKLLSFSDLYDYQDSAHTPFMCGMSLKPIVKSNHVAYLFSTINIILSSDYPNKQYIVNCIKEHLALPEYNELSKKYTALLNIQKNNLSNFLKDY